MYEEQKTIPIEIGQLLPKVSEFHSASLRLIQIGCTKTPTGLELNYSFADGYKFHNYRITFADTSTSIPSISNIYWSAFLYENEIHDLYGVNFTGLNINYQGNFYRSNTKHAFNPKETK